MSDLIDGPLGLKVDPVAGLVIGLKGNPVGSKDPSGYLQVDLRSRGGGITQAHRIVWQAVNGPIPPDREINHINGVKTDNRPANLELVTRQENVLHAYRTGLKSNEGENHPSHILTENDVRQIRARYVRRVVPAKEIARDYGVSTKCILDVVGGKTWRNVA